MITINLNKNAMKKEQEINDFLEHEFLYNCNLSNQSYEIVEVDNDFFGSVVDDDDEESDIEATLIKLMNGINNLVDGDYR